MVAGRDCLNRINRGDLEAAAEVLRTRIEPLLDTTPPWMGLAWPCTSVNSQLSPKHKT
jgi:hypothetical protein